MTKYIPIYRRLTLILLLLLFAVYFSLFIYFLPRVISAFFMQLVLFLDLLLHQPSLLTAFLLSQSFYLNLAVGLLFFYLIYRFLQALKTSLALYRRTRSFIRALIVRRRSSDYFLVDSSSPLALTIGFFRPQIFLSTSLRRHLSTAEFQAVLDHEICHRRHLDPLKDFIFSFIKSALPPLPGKNYLFSSYFTLTELTCDLSSLSRNPRRPLISALYRLISLPSLPSPASVLAFTAASDRVRILLGQGTVSLKKIFFSYLALVSLLFIFTFSLSRPGWLFDCRDLLSCFRDLFTPSSHFTPSSPSTGKSLNYCPQTITHPECPTDST